MILLSGNTSANLILPHTEWRVQREKDQQDEHDPTSQKRQPRTQVT